MPLGSNPSSFLSAFYDGTPTEQFYASIPQTGNTAMKEYFRGQSNRIYGDYTAAYGRGLQSGQAIGLYPDYLKDFPWLQNFYNQSPSARGETPTRYAPRVRYSG